MQSRIRRSYAASEHVLVLAPSMAACFSICGTSDSTESKTLALIDSSSLSLTIYQST